MGRAAGGASWPCAVAFWRAETPPLFAATLLQRLPLDEVVLGKESSHPAWILTVSNDRTNRTVKVDGRVPAIGSKEELPTGPGSRWRSVVSALLLADLLMRESRTRTSAR